MRDLNNTPYGNFIWWVGIVEETTSDPSQLGRVRVRAYGFHPTDLETSDLPLAPVLNGGTARINAGQMVLGFFMDGMDAQQPVVLGVLGGGTSSAAGPFSGNPFEGSFGGVGAAVNAVSGLLESVTRPLDGSCPQIKTGLVNSAAAWNGYHERNDKKCLMELFKSQIGANFDPSTTPWCGVFVASILASQGYPYPRNYPSARSYASPKYNTHDRNGYGTVIWEKGTKDSQLDVANIQVGDIAILSFGAISSGKGHVAFVAANGMPGNRIMLLGGNQSDKVSLVPYKTEKLLSVVRPPGKKPETFDPKSINSSQEGSTR